MQTVLSSLASTLGVLALAGILISLLIRLIGSRRIGSSKLRGSPAARSVEAAKTLLAEERISNDLANALSGVGTKPTGGPAASLADAQAANPGKLPPRFDVNLLERFSPKPRLWSSRSWIVPSVAGGAAAVLSVVVGTQMLYVPMVSETYRHLYQAYCKTDGIAEVLSRRVANRKLAATGETNACRPPPAADAAAPTQPAGTERPPTPLTQDDVFFLLDALSLRDPREKTKAELFATESPTKNHALAVWLTDPAVYTVGTPTSLLLLRIAGKVGAGFSVEVSCPASASTKEATQIGFKTAVLSAVLAQQPAPNDPHAALGAKLLGAEGPSPLNSVVPFNQSACDGDKALAAVDLGPEFGGSGFAWRSPLLEKPAERLTDAQIISLVLGWAGWTPATNPSQVPPQDAAIAFMEAVASEAGGTAEVRDARIAVNFFIGWERLIILCIVAFLGLCLLWQQIVNSDDARHLRDIKETIEETSRDKRLRALSLAILAKRLYRSVGRSGPREVLVAALEVYAQVLGKSSSVDFDRVHRVADHEVRIMDRSRFFFLAGLPLLPTIGFIGTVRSLIEALALADRIPRARTAIEQVAAVSDVTSTLSLCFSTTFMALGALLIFAPLDLWQASSERRVVEETERLLDPGF